MEGWARALRCAKRSDMPEARRIAWKDMGVGPLSLFKGGAEACGGDYWIGPSMATGEVRKVIAEIASKVIPCRLRKGDERITESKAQSYLALTVW